MKDIMAMTKNVRRFLAAVRELNDRPTGVEGMAILWGEPGEGKSTTVAFACNTLSGIFLRANTCWSITAMLAALMVELGLPTARRRATMMENAVQKLTEQPSPIFIDEADYLFTRADMLDAMRDIYDVTRNRLRATESGPTAFDIAGTYMQPQEVTPVLTVKELDKCLAVVREAIAAAVEADRSQENLKTMARDLLSYVTVVKLERDRLVRIVLDNPMPLHQVCLMRGLPYAFAERILAVNSIPNPNFTSGEIDVYVR